MSRFAVQRSQTFSSHQPFKHHSKSYSVSQDALVTPASTEKTEMGSLTNHMPLSSTLVTQWIEALETFDSGRLKDALKQFQNIEPHNSKISYNIGSILATLGDYEGAIANFKLAIENDNYMAISYFQIGVCRFLTGLYKKAAGSFNTALKLLRGNSVVNYQQLGMDYKLYSCEIMYNRALSYIYSGQMSVGIYDLGFAVKERKYISEHAILDEALNHFSNTEEFKSDVDMRSMLKLPEKVDKSTQRFSLLGPPKVEYYKTKNSTSSDEPPQTSRNLPPLLKKHNELPSLKQLQDEEKNKEQKEMMYSLFSVPQGSIFRLTEVKVQSILNDKYIDSLVKGKPLPKNDLQLNRSASPDSIGSLEHSTPWPSKVEMPFATKTPSDSSKMHNKHNGSSGGSSSSIGSLTTPLRQPKNMPSLPSLPNPNTSPPSGNAYRGTHSNNSSYSNDNSSSDQENSHSRTLSQSNSGQRSRSKPSLERVNEQPKNTSIPQVGRRPSRENNPYGTQQYPPSSQALHPVDRFRDVDSYYENSAPIMGMMNNGAEPPKRSNEREKLALKTTYPDLNGKDPTMNMITPVPKQPGYNYGPLTRSLPSPPTFPSQDEPSKVTPLSPAVKVKIRFEKETRVTMIPGDATYSEFKRRVAAKIDMTPSDEDPTCINSFYMRRKDEEGDLILLGDQEDLDVTLEELRSQPVATDYQKLTVYIEVMKS